MTAGPESGASGSKDKVHALGMSLFVRDDGGYTSLAVAISLLLSLSLTFSLTAGTWLQNRSADIQSVADASALAGVNVVGSYYTLATCLDALVLTMGMTGVVVMGAGLVVSATPGLSAAGAKTMQAGKEILQSRQEFATSAVSGLKSFEATLPLLIVVRSGAVVEANATDSASYVGCAIPYPAESESDFSSLDTQIETNEVESVAQELQGVSDKAKEA